MQRRRAYKSMDGVYIGCGERRYEDMLPGSEIMDEKCDGRPGDRELGK